MENSMKFTLAIDRINKRIAELNIKISQNLTNEELKTELKTLIEDKERIYKGNSEDFKNLLEKYGSTE